MGGLCGNTTVNEESEMHTEILDDYERYKAFCLEAKDKAYVCVYNFRESIAVICDPVFDRQLHDYSVLGLYPVLYAAGGVFKPEGGVSNKLWAASMGEGTIHLGELAPMQDPRGKPFLVSPKNGDIYAVGGYQDEERRGTKTLRSCEKYTCGKDQWVIIEALSIDPRYVVAVEGYVYSFGIEYGSQAIEVLDANHIYGGWDKKMLISPEGQLPEKSALVLSPQTPNKLLLFGGEYASHVATNAIFSIDIVTGRVSKEANKLPAAVTFTECMSYGKSKKHFITTSYQLCSISSNLCKCELKPTDIEATANKQGIVLKS